MLAVMFNHTDQGLAPMPKTKEGAYFLEADPIYFREILNYLRYGQSTEDPDLFRGFYFAWAKYEGSHLVWSHSHFGPKHTSAISRHISAR